jgi:hypothetical protein
MEHTPFKGESEKMAEQMLPYHKPHEQLRTEPPKQKEHSDKYVTAMVSGESNVDMSFRAPILSKSSDYFKVGIDELTVNLSSLSMLEYDVDDVIFRIVRRGYIVGDLAGADGEEFGYTNSTGDVGLPNEFQMPDGPVGEEAKFRNAFTFKVDRPYNTMLEILNRCTQIATAVGSYIRDEGLINGEADLWNIPIPASTLAEPLNFEHFRINLTSNGQLQFSGNKVFWANFIIQVPNEKYRQILLRDPDLQFISIDFLTGQLVPVPFEITTTPNINIPLPVTYDTVYAALGIGIPGDYDYGALVDDFSEDPSVTDDIQFVADGNVLATLDRRVTLEVGCSLPLKNSPMIDHGVEAPDYVLGRYMLHQPYNQSTTALTVTGLGARTLQGPKDRICYHHLQAQQKIQLVRIRLWARVRTYDKDTKKWGMKTIVCPTEDIDYWHIRLHFVEK